ncbi:MAG: hypothetical protein JWN33_281 [Candidatus Saccharibacteria bacterium]|nr:hypothetical protein [Candidatus Saccharibacteria bacterium]
MNKYLPQKAKDIKGPVAVAELRRAHYIIAMLALALSLMIVFVSLFETQFNVILSTVAVILLAFVAAVSLATVFVLRKR